MKKICYCFFIFLLLIIFLSCTSNGKVDRPKRLVEIQGIGFTNAKHNLKQKLARQDAQINLIEQATGISFFYDHGAVKLNTQGIYEGLKITKESNREYGPDKLMCLVEGTIMVLPRKKGKKDIQTGQASHKYFNIALDLAKKQALKKTILKTYKTEKIRANGKMYYQSIQYDFNNNKFYVKADFEFIFSK